MKNIAKKAIIYSMVGIMQVGFSVSVIEASPQHSPQQIIQLDNHDNDRQREHDERLRQENERHEREMRRRDNESDQEWHERQKREKKRHEDALRDISIFLIGIEIGS